MNRIGISTLPNEMIESISTFLGDKDLGNSRLASRVANSGSLFEWRKRALLDKDGTPPLLWAAICDQHSLIHYLHAIKPDIGLNLDYLASDDMSPLAAACCFGNDKSIKALLKGGAEINYSHYTASRDSALLYTASTEHYEIVSKLLRWGADGLAISCGGDTVLHLAASPAARSATLRRFHSVQLMPCTAVLSLCSLYSQSNLSPPHPSVGHEPARRLEPGKTLARAAKMLELPGYFCRLEQTC